MNESPTLLRRHFLALSAGATGSLWAKYNPAIPGSTVTLSDAHKGTVEIDLRIMNQFGELPEETREFYLASRKALTGEKPMEAMAKVCRESDRKVIGGPLLGDLTATSVSIWMNLPEAQVVTVTLQDQQGGKPQTITLKKPARIFSLPCPDLTPDTAYRYEVRDEEQKLLGQGSFTTLPEQISEKPFRISFGGDFHKVGMYRPELIKLIQERDSRAMLLIGDSAVDGRKDDFGLINTDYLLRNLSPPLQELFAHTPTSATWDDHDYWGNDTSGTLTNSKKPINVDGLRESWKTNWNNPQRHVERAGIYFETHLGPIHYLALDTRSCRVNDQQGKLNSFLGREQMEWLKTRIQDTTAPFLIISGGTMWSDYISDGKDSWGKWDQEGREEIFKTIDAKKGTKVMLLCGDRHGARAFAIPRPNGQVIHEFEVGTLGGCPGPEAFGKDKSAQLFGYPGRTWAVGEFTFDLEESVPRATFKLHNEKGVALETIVLKAV